MPNPLVQCDCLGHCNHTYPEVSSTTKYNHRRDDRIREVQAILLGELPPRHRETGPDRTHRNHTSQSQRPHPFGTGTPGPSQPNRGPTPANPLPPPVPLSDRVTTALQLIESELHLRLRLPTTSLAKPLVFVNKPADHGVYERERPRPLIPNSGIYRLQVGATANRDFLEHESRLWEMLGHIHLLPASDRKDELEARIMRELDRGSREKALHWGQQRMCLDMQQVIVFNGLWS